MDELSFDKRCEALETVVRRQSIHREILYRTLGYCQSTRVLHDVEDTMAAFPEFSKATQSQYHFLRTLVKAGGLKREYTGEDGTVLDETTFEGLSEDEIDDLIYDEQYTTTDIGAEIVRRHTPLARLAELMTSETDRAETYLELLAYCDEQPRTYKDVATLLQGRDVLTRTSDGKTQRIQPSVLLDRLHSAAGLVFQSGWTTTEEGKAFLQEQRQSEGEQGQQQEREEA